MNRPVTLVVLGKYKEVFEPFVRSFTHFRVINQLAGLVFVRDGNEINTDIIKGPKIKILQGPEVFSMAGNGNLGMKAVPADHDILYCGDDIRFLELDTIAKLQAAAYSDEKIGILSPRIVGRGSPTLVNPEPGVTEVKPLEMWFPCVYIKREVIDKIGYLDDDFSDFGSDDLDYCTRAKMAGYKLAVTSDVAVCHQASPEGGPTTFCKNIGVDAWQQQQATSYSKMRKKWNTTVDSFEKYLASGDIKHLKPEPAKSTQQTYEDGLLCTQAEAKEYLKTRHLFIATPAYGGWLSVNYVNSLLALVDMCNQLQINRTISFVYNESLITRARNKLANDFRKVESATDFVFIDADIGFDARDIVMLMLRSEDIIGAPCVRKNLRLDRVAAAAKKNGRDYTVEELEYLTGEYIFNFVQDPSSINLGQMTEVLDVGTGLMRVRRQTFDKFEKAYPEGWTLPMVGEAGVRVPTYMFFQAGPDEESRKNNPSGLPDYVSEDYWFCRKARLVGMKTWLAPWIKTTHMGSYMFKGDLEAVAKVGGVLR